MTFIPTLAVRRQAQRGLRMAREARYADAVVIERARRMAVGDPVSVVEVVALCDYFASTTHHDGAEYALHGGDAGKRWAARRAAEVEQLPKEEQ